MLGFVYLVLILGWIIIVLFLKCKKTITPHFTLADNYADALGADRRPSIHVIQLPTDQRQSENDILSQYHQRSNSLREHSHRSQRSSLEERIIETTYPTDAVINPAFQNDEEYIINAPPPSYDEVMRQPNVYPKVQHKTSDSNI